jgi:hypothetical protein
MLHCHGVAGVREGWDVLFLYMSLHTCLYGCIFRIRNNEVMHPFPHSSLGSSGGINSPKHAIPNYRPFQVSCDHRVNKAPKPAKIDSRGTESRRQAATVPQNGNANAG